MNAYLEKRESWSRYVRQKCSQKSSFSINQLSAFCVSIAKPCNSRNHSQAWCPSTCTLSDVMENCMLCRCRSRNPHIIRRLMMIELIDSRGLAIAGGLPSQCEPSLLRASHDHHWATVGHPLAGKLTRASSIEHLRRSCAAIINTQEIVSSSLSLYIWLAKATDGRSQCLTIRPSKISVCGRGGFNLGNSIDG